MARLNIDSQFFGDPRIEFLAELIGDDKLTTQGRLLNVWHHAACKITDTLSHDDIDLVARKPGFAEKLLSSRLARKVEEGLYLCGLGDRIEWLRKSKEAGKRSAQVRKEKYGTAQPRTNPEPIPKGARTNPEGARTNSEPIVIDIDKDIDKDNNSSTNVEEGKSKLSPPTPFNDFLKLWNDHCSPLNQVRTLNTQRKDKIRIRWREQPDLGYWRECVTKMASSSFCRDGKWASFDWLIKNSTNHVKVIEGNYDDKQNQDGNAIDWDEVWQHVDEK